MFGFCCCFSDDLIIDKKNSLHVVATGQDSSGVAEYIRNENHKIKRHSSSITAVHTSPPKRIVHVRQGSTKKGNGYMCTAVGTYIWTPTAVPCASDFLPVVRIACSGQTNQPQERRSGRDGGAPPSLKVGRILRKIRAPLFCLREGWSLGEL